MAISEVQRFRIKGFPMTFERRPISSPPEAGAFASVDDGTTLRTGGHWISALWKSGEWVGLNGKPLPFEPTFWTVTILDERHGKE